MVCAGSIPDPNPTSETLTLIMPALKDGTAACDTKQAKSLAISPTFGGELL
jgi:hypothetical protein